jgi:hypothetical protein
MEYIKKEKLEKFEGYKNFLIEGIAGWKESIKKPKWAGVIPSAYSGLVDCSGMAAYCCYVVNEIDAAKKYAIIVPSAAIDYFYGKWRSESLTDEKTIDPIWWKRRGTWVDEFRHAIAWASCLGEWDKIAKIAEYPTPECVEYLPIKVNPHLSCYLCLAAVIRGENLDPYKKYVDIIERGTKRKEKLMLEVLKAIESKDKDSFEKTFLDYMKFYKQKEFPKDDFDDKVSFDGTILFNIAKHNNLQVVFPAEYLDYYIDLERKQ